MQQEVEEVVQAVDSLNSSLKVLMLQTLTRAAIGMALST